MVSVSVCLSTELSLCAVLYMALNMCLWQVSLAVQFRELIGYIFVTFGGGSWLQCT